MRNPIGLDIYFNHNVSLQKNRVKHETQTKWFKPKIQRFWIPSNHAISYLKKQYKPFNTPNAGTAECYFKWGEGGGLSAEGTICERRRRVTSRGSRGMPPRKISKSRVSEMPFPALWGQNLQNSNGQKTTYNMSKFTCSLDRIIFQNLNLHIRLKWMKTLLNFINHSKNKDCNFINIKRYVFVFCVIIKYSYN